MAVAAPDAHLLDIAAGERVTAYARAVVAGEIVVGVKVRRACQRHLDDLEHGAERGLRFDAAEAGWAIRFFPAVLRHYKGEWGPIPGERREGLPIELEDWEAFFIGAIFGWLRENPDRSHRTHWIRRFRKAYLKVAKKNGKTLLAGGLGILLGFFDGEPGAEVYSVATKRDQARLLWGDAATMVAKSAALRRRIASTVKSLFDRESNSLFQPLSAEEGGEEGVNPYAILVDELHRHRDRGMLDMVNNSTGARLWALLAIITTSGEHGESVWSEEDDYASDVVMGRIEDDTYLALLYEIDEDDDPFDEACWPKANPNLGISVKLDEMRARAREAKASPQKLNAFLRLRLNRRASAFSRFFDIRSWDAEQNRQEPTPLDGAEAWAGLDLGWSRDLSSCFLWIPRLEQAEDGELVEIYDVHARVWIPEEAAQLAQTQHDIPYSVWAADGWITLTEGNIRDDDAIEADIVDLSEKVRIRSLRYDRAMASSLVTRLARRGFEVDPVAQTPLTVSPALKEWDRLLALKRIRHGGNPVLRWMAANADVLDDGNGNVRLKKPNKNSPLKIDGISAGQDAIVGWLADREPPEDDSAYAGLTARAIARRMAV